MRRFKKAIAITLSALMLFASSSCKGKDDNKERATRQQNIIATIQRDTQATTEKTTTEATTEDISTTEPATDNTTEAPVSGDAEEAFKAFEDDLFKDSVTNTYLDYHYSVKDGSKYGLERPEAGWSLLDWSDEAIEKDKKEGEEYYNRLLAIDKNGLSEKDKVSYDIYKEMIELNMQLDEYSLYAGELSPMRGLQSDFANYFTDYPFYEKQDVEDYVILLEKSKEYIDNVVEYEKYRASKGYAMTDNNIDDVIEQCETFVKDGDKHFLIELFDNRVDALTFLTDDEKKAYKERNKKAIIDQVIPGFNDIISGLKSLKGKAPHQMGLSYYDNGDKYYTLLLQRFSNSKKTPEEVIEYYDSRLAEIKQEMRDAYLADPMGYEYFISNYGNHLKGADEMASADVIEQLMKSAMKDYPEIPGVSHIPYNVDYLDKTLETIMENVLAYYRSPALDMPDNNIIKVNGGHLDGQWATLAHEGCPGHMYQYNYYMSTNPSNMRAAMGLIGYQEGWAKYAEYGSYYAYDYPDTDYDETIATLTRLESEYNMLVMGIVDIRVNYSGWTVEDLESYFSSNGLNAAAAEKIFNVMTGDPAAYQSYILGYYELKELRVRAEKELGAKFDPVEFNKVILENGPCQYDILGEQVDKYIKSK